jgi:hypothetical protein
MKIRDLYGMVDDLMNIALSSDLDKIELIEKAKFLLKQEITTHNVLEVRKLIKTFFKN